MTPPLIQDPMAMLAGLLAVLAGLHSLQRYPTVERVFNVVLAPVMLAPGAPVPNYDCEE
ncbi:hypothetical protein ACIHQR_08475 [Corallococcus coralloides]|uniref:hypothetical protein n=1 Tax=Corallococcus coralloides TaxID=184914 RepID=UPI0038514CA8